MIIFRKNADKEDSEEIKVIQPDDSFAIKLEKQYNPLLNLNTIEDVENLAKEIVNMEGIKAENEHLREYVIKLMESVIYHTCAIIPEEKISLIECFAVLKNSYNSQVNRYKDIIDGLPFEHPARVAYKPLEKLDSNILRNIFDIVSKKLQNCIKKQGKYVTICTSCGNLIEEKCDAPGIRKEIYCNKCHLKIWVEF